MPESVFGLCGGKDRRWQGMKMALGKALGGGLEEVLGQGNTIPENAIQVNGAK